MTCEFSKYVKDWFGRI